MSENNAINSLIHWGVASRTRPGQNLSGDLHLILPGEDSTLVAVVDGVGHGNEANEAASRAIELLNKYTGESVIWLAEHCHAALRSTRGVVMTIAVFDSRESTVTTLGIGNVESVLLRASPSANPSRETVLLRSGVVGYQLPSLHASVYPLYRGDLLVFGTDGVKPSFADRVNLSEPLQPMAERMLEQNFRGNDDALVLTIRYLGPSRA